MNFDDSVHSLIHLSLMGLLTLYSLMNDAVH